MVKKVIRAAYSEKRAALLRAGFSDLNKAMEQQFKMLSFKNINTLLSYHPLSNRCEFDVRACNQMMKEWNPGLQILLPRICADMINMEAVDAGGESTYVTNSLGIPEPTHTAIVPPIGIDLAFVPLLAFDCSGYRVGYGKGFYDRYLSRCRPQVIKLGFSFFDPVSAIEDIDEFDVPLNYCITPTRVYEF